MKAGEVEWLVPEWPAPATVRAAVTTRRGGFSRPPFDSLNLAAHVGDGPERVGRNRAALRAALALPAEPLWLNQVHGAGVVDAAAADFGADADASFATRPGVVCTVMTADCLPVLFCDREGRRVAAAHAGWRGLAGGVLEATVAALTGEEEGEGERTEPGRLLAWLGPAIGPDAFEVGDEVRAAFIAHDLRAATAFRRSPAGRWLADIYALARLRLERAGVMAVSGGGLCTYLDGGRFYSYRRDGVTGRMASLVWIEP